MSKFDKNVYFIYGFTKYIAGEQANSIQAQHLRTIVLSLSLSLLLTKIPNELKTISLLQLNYDTRKFLD